MFDIQTPFDINAIPHFIDEDIEAEKIKLYKSHPLDMHALFKCQHQDLNWGRLPSASVLLTTDTLDSVSKTKWGHSYNEGIRHS